MALNLSGPAGAVQIPAPDYDFEPNRPFVTPGDYTVDNGPGSPAIGPFKATFTLPPVLKWTNQDTVENVDRTQDFTVTWSGGVPDKEVVVIVGLSVSNQATARFLCTEKTSAGKFTIPAWVLSKLPKSDFIGSANRPAPGGLLGIGTVPLTSIGRFSATGLDFGVFTYEQAVVNLALFQ